jgi:hypothetical protein
MWGTVLVGLVAVAGSHPSEVRVRIDGSATALMHGRPRPHPQTGAVAPPFHEELRRAAERDLARDQRLAAISGEVVRSRGLPAAERRAILDRLGAEVQAYRAEIDAEIKGVEAIRRRVADWLGQLAPPVARLPVRHQPPGN